MQRSFAVQPDSTVRVQGSAEPRLSRRPPGNASDSDSEGEDLRFAADTNYVPGAQPFDTGSGPLDPNLRYHPSPYDSDDSGDLPDVPRLPPRFLRANRRPQLDMVTRQTVPIPDSDWPPAWERRRPAAAALSVSQHTMPPNSASSDGALSEAQQRPPDEQRARRSRRSAAPHRRPGSGYGTEDVLSDTDMQGLDDGSERDDESFWQLQAETLRTLSRVTTTQAGLAPGPQVPEWMMRPIALRPPSTSNHTRPLALPSEAGPITRAQQGHSDYFLPLRAHRQSGSSAQNRTRKGRDPARSPSPGSESDSGGPLEASKQKMLQVATAASRGAVAQLPAGPAAGDSQQPTIAAPVPVRLLAAKLLGPPPAPLPEAPAPAQAATNPFAEDLGPEASPPKVLQPLWSPLFDGPPAPPSPQSVTSVSSRASSPGANTGPRHGPQPDHIGSRPFDPKRGVPLEDLDIDTEMGTHSYLEAKATAFSAVAAQRSFLLPSPLVHVAGCLSQQRDHVAVLHQQDGEATLQVLWLGAPEEALVKPPGPRLRPRVSLALGLSIEPPMGRLGAVSAPVVGELPLGPHLLGGELLAAWFRPDGPPRRLAGGQEQWLHGYVTASAPLDTFGRQQVTYHSGPAWPHEPWTQPLGKIRHPRVQIAPGGGALILLSVAPTLDPWAPAIVEDGVWLHVQRLAATGKRMWQRRMKFSLVPSGKPMPQFAWTPGDERTILVSNKGAHIFDTRPTRARPEVGASVRVPLPQCLEQFQTVAAGAINFSPGHKAVALNWTAYDETNKVVGRWGELIDLRRSDDEAAGLSPGRRQWHHGEDHQEGTRPFGMVQYAGETGDFVAAYGSVVRQMHPLDEALEGVDVDVRRYSGAKGLLTARRDRVLWPLAHTCPFFAMVSKHRMRLYVPWGEDETEPGKRRFVFQEHRPEYLRAFEQRGIAPSPNRVTMLPWFESQERFLYQGLDNDVLLRLDLRPGRGLRPPYFYPFCNAANNLHALRPHQTPWTLGDQSLPNII